MRMVNSLNAASNILKNIINNQHSGIRSEYGYYQPVNGKIEACFF